MKPSVNDLSDEIILSLSELTDGTLAENELERIRAAEMNFRNALAVPESYRTDEF
jgi:hypothetical protein